MKIGVVSDTHNNLKSVTRIIELFNEEQVSLVIHTGDITRPATLEKFKDLDANLIGVYGNNDQGEKEGLQEIADKCNFEMYDPPHEFTLMEKQVILVHDPLEFNGHLSEKHHLALHGHTHMYRNEVKGSQVIFNPGECAGHMKGYNAIGLVNMEDLSTSLLKF